MKTRIIILLITSISFLAHSAAVAQKIKRAAKVEVITEVKNRELIVLLRSEDEAVAKKLNPAEFKEYKESIDQINNRLKSAVKEQWTFHPAIHYLTKEEIAALDHRNNRYAVIALDLINIRLAGQIGRGAANHAVRLHVSLLEDYNPLKPVYYQDILGIATKQSVPTVRKMDIVAAVHMVQNHFKDRLAGKKRKGAMPHGEESQENSGMLATKTLLIDTIFMDEKLKLDKIKDNYPFAFEISNEKAIEAAQSSKDSRYAYVYLFTEADAANYFYHCIIDAETGKVISFSIPYGFHMNNMVDERHLKNYARNAEPKK